MICAFVAANRDMPGIEAIHVKLTPKGHKYRKHLIHARMAADEKLRKELTSDERATLLRLLKLVAELEF
jgi:DNA-binding MarR family transcriptional regulator